jgi:serine/threonine protein kinase
VLLVRFFSSFFPSFRLSLFFPTFLTCSAFGTVYSGVHNGTAEKHAIKEISKISAFEEADKKDLKAELVALSDVGHHPNLVRFFGAHYTLNDSVWV